MNPWLGILSVLGALGVLMGAVRLGQSLFPISAELSRKGVHIGMGLVCLSFPWIFQEPWPVVVLAILAVVGLAAARLLPILRRNVGSVLGGVERRSLGEFYFPIAVAIVFVLAQGNTILYIIPVLTLTIADSVGALVGVRYGFARYQTDEGLKSAEGSIAFFTAAFLTCHVPLLLYSQTGRVETLLIGLIAGILVMLLEAISWRGQDNLIIPIGMFILLKLYLPMSTTALLSRLVVILALVGFVLFWRKRTTLSDSAVLAGALSGYAVWAFGGWPWLVPLLLLFLVYVLLPSFPGDARPTQNLHAVTRVMAGAFFWLLLAKLTHREEYFFAPYLLCVAAHTGNIITARLRVVRAGLSRLRILALGWAISTVLFTATWFGAWPYHPSSPFAYLMVPVAIALSIACFFPLWPTEHTPENRGRVWASETLLAVIASLIGLLVH